MASLRFYGGVNEIGGNKIMVEDRGTKIFLDFGESFGYGADYFTGYLLPRAINGLGDHFEFGLMPKIPGLYAEDKLASTDLPYREPEVDGIFLSHAHFDHITHICFTDPKIPVYLGAGTKLFVESMEETSGFCDYGEHEYRTFRSGKSIQVGEMSVEPIHVDHSIPAAYGFIVRTSDATIAYTGDFRLHGPRRDMSEEFIKKVKECHPDALICEGTRMALEERRQNFTEQQVEEESARIVASTDKAVFTTRYSRDMDRLRSTYNAAVRGGRELVISPKTAYLLVKLAKDRHLDLPDPLKDDHVRVYYKRKKSGKYEDEDYYVWERQFMDKMVDAEYIRNNQKGVVMDLDFYQFAELIDIRPERGCHFIHSMSEPFSEEDIEERVLHNWLDHFGIEFHQLHASGHLSREQIEQVVGEIGAKKVFPVHTEGADLFEKVCPNVQPPIKGRAYPV